MKHRLGFLAATLLGCTAALSAASVSASELLLIENQSDTALVFNYGDRHGCVDRHVTWRDDRAGMGIKHVTFWFFAKGTTCAHHPEPGVNVTRQQIEPFSNRNTTYTAVGANGRYGVEVRSKDPK